MIQFGLGAAPGSSRSWSRTNSDDVVCGKSEYNSAESWIMTKNYAIRTCALAGVVASLAIVASLSSSAIADDAVASSALKAIQGVWATSENDSIDAKWEFKGESLKASVNGMEYVGKIKVDDKAKPHLTLDIDLTD